jgi:hypothetical protein
MDKLLAVTSGVGQPLRPEDWSFIQNATKEALTALVIGLMGHTGSCVIHGLVVVDGDGTRNVTEGVIFINDELFYVPAKSVTDAGELWLLYLTPDITTDESRTFKDAIARDVWEYRRYKIGYGTSIPSGSIAFPGANLLTWITQYVIAYVPLPPAQLVKTYTISHSSASLNMSQVLIPAMGAGTAIKVLSITARISPLTPLQAGIQTLDVFYLADENSASVGSYSNEFIESTTAKMCDMTAAPEQIFVNSPVLVQLSEATPPTGSATIKFTCFYVVIPV